MRPCPLCRSEIPESQDRCPSCGTRVKRAETPPPAFVRPPQTPPVAFGARPTAPPYLAPWSPPAQTQSQFSPPPPTGGAGAGVGGPPPAANPYAAPQFPYRTPPAPVWMPPVDAPVQKRSAGRVFGKVLAVLGGVFALLVGIGLVARVVDQHNASKAVSAYAKGSHSVTYTSPEGNFSASFPTNPVPTDQTMQSANGPILFHDEASHPGRSYAFEVGYMDFANGVSFPDPDAALQGVVDSMAGEVNGQVTERSPDSLDSMRAENFVIKYKEKNQDAVAVGRVALGNNRLYLLAVTAPTAQHAAFDRLAGSFHLLSPSS
jgi:hypothetical protein